MLCPICASVFLLKFVFKGARFAMTYMVFVSLFLFKLRSRGKDWWSRVCGVNYTPSYCSYDMRCKPDYVIDSNNPNAIFGSEGADYASLTSGSDLYFGRDGDEHHHRREGRTPSTVAPATTISKATTPTTC